MSQVSGFQLDLLLYYNKSRGSKSYMEMGENAMIMKLSKVDKRATYGL